VKKASGLEEYTLELEGFLESNDFRSGENLEAMYP
jgi:hypothetical protein